MKTGKRYALWMCCFLELAKWLVAQREEFGRSQKRIIDMNIDEKNSIGILIYVALEPLLMLDLD